MTANRYFFICLEEWGSCLCVRVPVLRGVIASAPLERHKETTTFQYSKPCNTSIPIVVGMDLSNNCSIFEQCEVTSCEE